MRTQKRRKSLIVFATAVLLVISVSIASAETLTVWAPGFTPLDETWGAVTKAFEAKHPGVHVEIVTGKSGPDPLLAAIAAGVAPDVAWTWTEALPTFVHLDALYPLDRFITSDIRQDYYDIDYTRYQGHIWGLPGVAGGRMLFYNKSYLQEAGLTEPQNWDDFRVAAKRLTRRDGDKVDVWGFRVDVNQGNKKLGSNAGWTPWFTQAGGVWFTEDQHRTLINSPAGREALTFLYQLAHEDRSASLGQGSLKSGDLAMDLKSISTGVEYGIDNPQLDIGVVPALKNKRQTSWYAQDFFTVLKTAKNPKLAFDFMNFANCEEGKLILQKNVKAVPVCRSEGNPFPDNDLFEEVLANMAVLEKRPIVLEGNQIYHTIVAEETGKAVLGEIPVEEALARAEERVNTVLKEAWEKVKKE